MYQEKRPTCVTIIGWAWIIIGGLMCLPAIMVLYMWGMVGEMTLNDPDMPFIIKIFPLLAIIQIGVAISGFVSGINFLKLKAWARNVLEGLTWLLLVFILCFMVSFVFSWISMISVDTNPGGTMIMGAIMVAIIGIYGVPLGIMLKYLRGNKIKNAIAGIAEPEGEQTPTIGQVPQKSTFVTVLAWVFIVIAGFVTFISMLQNIAFYTMFPHEEINKAMQQPNIVDQISTFEQFMFSHFKLFLFAFLIVAATSLISAIALLKRKNWARIVFIVIMSLGIIWNIFNVIMQYMTFPSLSTEDALPNEFESMRTMILIMATAFCVLFGWIIKKLSSAKIKAEFD